MSRTILLPFESPALTAKHLDQIDRLVQIRMCELLLRSESGPWHEYKNALCAYGVFVSREAGQNPGVFVTNLKGDVKWPKWIPDYMINHQRFLSLIGWLRYFDARGFTDEVAERLRQKNVIRIVKESSDLLTRFKILDAWLDDNNFEKAARSYEEFGPPECRALYPGG